MQESSYISIARERKITTGHEGYAISFNWVRFRIEFQLFMLHLIRDI